jgi:hypothetical protein
MQKITITEGLVSLKTLNNRIENEITSTTFAVSSQKGKQISGFKSVDDFVARAKSQYQSIVDLINRRNAIKSKIVESNALTKVVIAGTEYTVAGAIERKASVKYELQLINTLQQQFNRATAIADRANTDAQTRLDNLINTTFGKDSKVDATLIKSMSDSFWGENECLVRDPLSITNVVSTMSKDVENFLSNVDVVLSISNATTFIEV